MTNLLHATLDLHLEAPPQVQWENQTKEARITFDKTLKGHYHGKSGYKRVGCLLLTWEDDDMQCKQTEVGEKIIISAFSPF